MRLHLEDLRLMTRRKSWSALSSTVSTASSMAANMAPAHRPATPISAHTVASLHSPARVATDCTPSLVHTQAELSVKGYIAMFRQAAAGRVAQHGEGRSRLRRVLQAWQACLR